MAQDSQQRQMYWWLSCVFVYLLSLSKYSSVGENIMLWSTTSFCQSEWNLYQKCICGTDSLVHLSQTEAWQKGTEQLPVVKVLYTCEVWLYSGKVGELLGQLWWFETRLTEVYLYYVYNFFILKISYWSHTCWLDLMFWNGLMEN